MAKPSGETRRAFLFPAPAQAIGGGACLEEMAEGVEAEAQLAFLREHGCDSAQGYLLGRPIAAADAWHYLDVVAADRLALNDSRG